MSLRRYLSIFLRTVPWKFWVTLALFINVIGQLTAMLDNSSPTRLNISDALLLLLSQRTFSSLLFVPACIWLIALANPLCRAGWIPSMRFSNRAKLTEWQQLSYFFAAIAAFVLCGATIVIGYSTTSYFLDNQMHVLETITRTFQGASFVSLIKAACILGFAVVVLAQVCLIIDIKSKRGGFGFIGVITILVVIYIISVVDNTPSGLAFAPHTNLFAQYLSLNQSVFLGVSLPLQAIVYWTLCFAIVIVVGRKIMNRPNI